MKKTICKILSVILMILIVLMPISASNKAFNSKNRRFETLNSVKIGFPIQGGLSIKDEDGNLGGYTYDYLQEIAQYTGWEYDFVQLEGAGNESLLKYLEMLQKGEIDILGGIVKNEESMKLFDFPEYGYGHSYLTLNVLAENTTINEANLQNVKDMRIAILNKKNETNAKLDAFCNANNIDVQYVEFESFSLMMEALKNREVDALVDTSLTFNKELRTIAQFGGTEYYFALTKGNSELLNEINRIILNIKKVKPYFESELYDKYFSNQSNTLYLSDQEKAFIKNSAPLKMIMVDNEQPIQYLNNKNEIAGIARDLLDTIVDQTGLKMEYILADNFAHAFELLQKGEGDAICGIPYDYSLAQQYNMIMTNTILSAPLVVLTDASSNEQTRDAKYCIVNRMQYVRESNAVLYDNLEKCLDAIKRKEVNFAYTNLYSAEYLINQQKYKKMRIVLQNEQVEELSIGIKKPVNSELIAILNKAMIHISQTQLESIIYLNTVGITPEVTLALLVEQNPLLSVGFITVFFLIIIGVGIVIMILHQKTNERLDVANKRYLQLSQLANEYIYEFDCKSDIITFSAEFSQLFDLPLKIERFSAMMMGIVKLPQRFNPDMFVFFKRNNSLIEDEELEISCRLPNGDYRWYRNKRVDIKNENGKIIYMIGKLVDIQTEKEEKENLKQQILKDGLTNIYNAIAIREAIEERLKSISKAGALLVIDIDNFKLINDQLGHYIGDLALVEFAQLCKQSISKWDLVGRLGGDEFAIFIDNAISFEHVETFCKKLCENARQTYTNSDGFTCDLTISIGGIFIEKECDFSQVYQDVDKVLYDSKHNGRDQYTLIKYE